MLAHMKAKRGTAEASSNDLFSKTNWGLVMRARDESTVALNTLCQKYRKPLLIWFQCQHQFRPLEPEDMVNGFLASKLQEQFLKTITPGRGKFRGFVLECLRNYVTSEWRKAKAEKRGGRSPHQAIEATNENGRLIAEPVSADPHADEAYDRAWAQSILSNAIARLEAELAAKGHLPLWHALQPHLYDEEEAPSYGRIAKQLGISENALYTAAHRLRA